MFGVVFMRRVMTRNDVWRRFGMVAQAQEAQVEDLAKSVGAALSRWRKGANYTQARAADLLGLEKETISRIETGAISPTLHRLGQFARLYGCPVAAFFAEADDSAHRIAALLDGLDAEDRESVIRCAQEISAIAKRAHRSSAKPAGDAQPNSTPSRAKPR
ncbi:helix-turn-helix domain-containing protein [Paraburkholderia tropica]|uniref:helix-turn-helix domain-containing protein n=1 Tax=Paraburkholderia tropica TaxID=92647 RepID=UPI002AAFD4DE|nr:helix-turn-helix transcriptional regulator [Paraburkholderia tropica]